MSTPQEVARYLENNVDNAIKALYSTGVIPHINAIIRLRTNKGQYLSGNARNTGYSKGHKKRRSAIDARIDIVNMDISGDMLNAMHGRIVKSKDGFTIEFGYIKGLSESTATRIARYHNIEGAGKNKRVRQFIGLSKAEVNNIAGFMRRKLKKS